MEICFIIDYHASELSLAMCHRPTGVHSLYYRLQPTNLRQLQLDASVISCLLTAALKYKECLSAMKLDCSLF